jgi:hypothetical protein
VKLLKDLLYTRNNVSLDVARLCSVLGVLAFLGLSIWHGVHAGEFDPVAFGGGWTATCAGCGGWIYARQKFEAEGAPS